MRKTYHAMCWLLIAVVFQSLSSVTCAAGSIDPVNRFAGRYSDHFQNGDVQGEKFWSDNVVEIVPVSPDATYFRILLVFYNGHTCDIDGVAQTNGQNLIFHDPAVAKCTLQISKQRDQLLLNELDPDLDCKLNYCGMRGGFDGITLPWRSRRPITYMRLLKGSREYRDAIKLWKQRVSAASSLAGSGCQGTADQTVNCARPVAK